MHNHFINTDYLHTASTHNAILFNKTTSWLSWCLPLLLLTSRTMADLGLVIVSILFLLKSTLEKDWSWVHTAWLKWAAILIAYLVMINTPLSMHPVDSLRYSLFFIRWPLFAIALSLWLLNSADRQRNFLISLGVVILLISSDTWLQYITGIDFLGNALFPNNRLTGPFSGPVVGIMLVRVIFLLLFSIFIFKPLQSTNKRFLLAMPVLIFSLLTIFISGERMAFILCLSGVIIIAIGFALQHKSIRLPLCICMLLTALILTLSISLMPTLSDRMVHNVIEKLQHFSTSDYGIVFGAAWEAWQQNPLFGSGLHTYKQHCELISALQNTGFSCTHPHNLYLHIGTETGWFGIILFIGMITNLYIAAIKPHLVNHHWLLASLAFTILSLSFWPLIGGISLLNNWVAALAWLGVGWVLAMAQVKNHSYSA